MMQLTELKAQIDSEERISKTDIRVFRSNSDIERSPFEKWQPVLCKNVFFEIDIYGSWLHNNTRIERNEMIKLFSTVLIKQENKHYLKTPQELIEVKVQDCPFVVTSWEYVKNSQDQNVIVVTTNVEEKYEVNEEFCFELCTTESLQTTSPLSVIIKDGLKARLHRNVYYQLVELLEEQLNEQGELKYTLRSGDYQFYFE